MTQEEYIRIIPKEEADEKKQEELGLSFVTDKNGLRAFVQLSQITLVKEVKTLAQNLGITAELNLKPMMNKMFQREHIDKQQPLVIADLSENASSIFDVEFLVHNKELDFFFERKFNHKGEDSAFEGKLPLLNIKAGMKIAKRIPSEELDKLKLFEDVFGVTRQDQFRKIIHFSVGTGADEQKDYSILATANGRLSLKDDKIKIDNKYIIANVDDVTSDEINFMGNVDVSSGVIEHFNIRAGEDITIHSSTEKASLTSGGEIVVDGSIAGQSEAKIRAKKLVKAKNINQAEVFCEQNCEFSSGAFHCTIHAHGKVISDKGALTGGFIYGATGVETQHLGGASGVETVVVAGFCKDIPLSLDLVVEEIKDLQTRMKNIAEKLKVYIDKPELVKSLTIEDEQRIKGMNTSMKKMKTRLIRLSVWFGNHDIDACENAKIIVKGSVHPGVTIRINNIYYEVPKEMKRVVFRGDMKEGKIAVTKFGD